MEEADKDWMMITIVGGWMFLLVPVHPGSPGQRTVKRLLLLLLLLWLQWFDAVGWTAGRASGL